MTDRCEAPTNDGGTCDFAAKYPDGKCGHHTEENEIYKDRNSKLTKERQEQIAQAIEQGKSLSSAARMAGVTAQTVYNWLNKGEQQEEGIYKEFFDRIAHAKGYGEDFYFNLALQLAKENGDHRFIASLMKQRYPESWGDTETGVDSDTIELNITEDVASTFPE